MKRFLLFFVLFMNIGGGSADTVIPHASSNGKSVSHNVGFMPKIASGMVIRKSCTVVHSYCDVSGYSFDPPSGDTGSASCSVVLNRAEQDFKSVSINDNRLGGSLYGEKYHVGGYGCHCDVGGQTSAGLSYRCSKYNYSNPVIITFGY